MLRKENLHHAHLLEGNKEHILPTLLHFFTEELGILVHGNPDYSYTEFDSIGIDDARQISFMQQKRPTIGDIKIFVITFNSITREAQNALLKVFEEPTVGTHFFLITHSTAQLLPTLTSRLLIHSNVKEEIIGSIAPKFMKDDSVGRLKIVKKILDSDTPKIEAIHLLSDIEKIVQGKLEKDISVDTRFEELYKVKAYLNDTSSSVKLLLEHLSLTLPKI